MVLSWYCTQDIDMVLPCYCYLQYSPCLVQRQQQQELAGADEQQLPRIYQPPPNEHWLRITGASNLTACRSNLPKTVLPKFTSVLKVLNFKCRAFDCIIRGAQ